MMSKGPRSEAVGCAENGFGKDDLSDTSDLRFPYCDPPHPVVLAKPVNGRPLGKEEPFCKAEDSSAKSISTPSLTIQVKADPLSQELFPRVRDHPRPPKEARTITSSWEIHRECL